MPNLDEICEDTVIILHYVEDLRAWIVDEDSHYLLDDYDAFDLSLDVRAIEPLSYVSD